MTPRYIHQQPDQAGFRWDQGELMEVLAEARYRQGLLQGRLEAMGPEAQQEIMAAAVTQEALGTTGIEYKTVFPHGSKSQSQGESAWTRRAPATRNTTRTGWSPCCSTQRPATGRN